MTTTTVAASQTEALLDRLVGFAVTSADSNLGLIDWIEHYLRTLGFAVHLIPEEGGAKAGLFASIGPRRPGGILLSAHTDVVPVEGQPWTHPPFALTRAGGRLYGRGTSDMKGFIASVLAGAETAARASLNEPFKIALSYDEEVGCLGIPKMIHHLEPSIGLPRLAIVGEPTGMQVAVGHKGKRVWQACFGGEAGHSALAPRFVNALHPAAAFVLALRDEQEAIARDGRRDPAYEIPHATLHAGRMSGGVSLNIVPDRAVVDYELRHLPGDDFAATDARLRGRAAAIAAQFGATCEIAEISGYPGLAIDPSHPAVAEVRALAGDAGVTRVAFGTEAGFFDQLGVPTVVCGPGLIARAHKADEWIDSAELAACDAMMGRIVAALSA